MEIYLTGGVSAHRHLSKSSPEWQAAYHLNKGPKAFAVWRTRQSRDPKKRQYLRLERFEFKDLNLRGADLTAINFKRSTFTRCDLRDASFRGGNLNQVTFLKCQLTGVDFEQARLVEADLSGHDLTGTNLYASIRDDWIIDGVSCARAWVTRSRQQGGDPEPFVEGEFEHAYGGKRFTLAFPDGGQPIDLIALPFHFRRLQESVPDAQLVLCGLRVTPSAAIEVRVLNSDVNHQEVAAAFEGSVVTTRAEVEGMLSALNAANGVALRQLDVIDRLLDRHAAAAPAASYVLGDGSNVYMQAYTSTTIQNQYLGLSPSEVLDLLNGLQELARRLDASPTAASNDLHTEVLELTAAVEQRDSTAAQGILKKVGVRLLEAAQEIGTSVLTATIQKAMGLDS
ncbi:MAG: pentapeptide repeat-containing protein [Erythrobacter sp.]|nr:pentapeptide repeat-containing protein [Erythrobacter sp.]